MRGSMAGLLYGTGGLNAHVIKSFRHALPHLDRGLPDERGGLREAGRRPREARLAGGRPAGGRRPRRRQHLRRPPEGGGPRPRGPPPCAPVAPGCNKFCPYCIVPDRRGRERSRTVDEIAREVAAHCARGVREVTLLGQTVEAYGKDLDERPDLADLFAAG